MDAHRPTVGSTIVGADGGPIGTIREVREDHLVVEHGTLARHKWHIPIDALALTADGAVAVNVPAGQVESQGWRHPPTSSYERPVPAAPEVPDTTMIQAAGLSAGTLSAPEAQGFARDVEASHEVLTNPAIDPDADEAIDRED